MPETFLAIDTQPQEHDITKELLTDKLLLLHNRISYHQQCHSCFQELSPGTVKLIVIFIIWVTFQEETKG